MTQFTDKELREIVCAKCGVVGGPLYKELLVYCNTCNAAAQHRYCMDPTVMIGALRPWSCEECSPIPVKSGTAKIKLHRDKPARVAKWIAAVRKERKKFKKATRKGSGQDSNLKLLHGVTSRSKDGEPSFHRDANEGSPASEKIDVSRSCCTEGQQLKKRKSILLQEDQRDEEDKLDRENLHPHEKEEETCTEDEQSKRGMLISSEHLDEQIEGQQQKIRRRLKLPEDYRSNKDREPFQANVGDGEALQNRGVLLRRNQCQLHLIPICIEDKQLRREKLMSEENCLKKRFQFNRSDNSFRKTSPEEESAASYLSPNVSIGQLPKNNAMDKAMDEDCVQDTEVCVETAGEKRLTGDEHDSDADPGKRIHNNASTDTICQASKSMMALVEGDEGAVIPLRNQTSALGVDAETLEPTPVEAPINSPTGCHLDTNGEFYIRVLPIIDPIWSGCFHIYNEQYGPFAGHLSTRACDRVWKISHTLPQALPVVRLSRLDLWPKSFQNSSPTENNIALFFFPSDSRNRNLLYQFIEDIIIHDHALKAILDDAELLVFTSNVLPEDYQRFQGKYYFWGVFKAKCAEANEATTEKSKKIVSEKMEDLAYADGLTKREAWKKEFEQHRGKAR